MMPSFHKEPNKHDAAGFILHFPIHSSSWYLNFLFSILEYWYGIKQLNVELIPFQ